MDRILIKLCRVCVCVCVLSYLSGSEIAPNNPLIIMHFMFPSRLILQHSPYDDDENDNDDDEDDIQREANMRTEWN